MGSSLLLSVFEASKSDDSKMTAASMEPPRKRRFENKGEIKHNCGLL